MRWIILAIFIVVFLAIEQGLSGVLSPPGHHDLVPSLLLILAVYIGLFGQTMFVLWAWLGLGLLYDLTHPVTMPLGDATQSVAIIGPGAIAYLLGAAAMLQGRGVVYRGTPLSIAVFTFAIGIVVHLAMVLVFNLRRLSFLFFPGDQIVDWSWSSELVGRFTSLGVTAVVAIFVGWFLLKTGSGIFAQENPKAGGRK